MNPQDRRAISTLRSCIESTTIYAVNQPASQRKPFSVDQKRGEARKSRPTDSTFLRAFRWKKFQRTVTRSIVCIP